MRQIPSRVFVGDEHSPKAAENSSLSGHSNRISFRAMAVLFLTLLCCAGSVRAVEGLKVMGKLPSNLKVVSWVNPRPGESHIVIFFDGSTYGSPCSAPLPNAKGVICETEDPKSFTVARLEIRTPGFKIYSRNLTPETHGGKVKYFNIGDVQLDKSGLPAVEQVIKSVLPNKYYKFDFTLRNPLKQKILITQILIKAWLPATSKDPCCCPPNAIFKIDDVFNLTGGGGRTRTVGGQFQETSSGTEGRITATGTIEEDGCHGNVELVLTLPASVLLPAEDYAGVQIILPDRLRIADKFYGFRGEHSDEHKGAPSSALISNGLLKHFSSIEFSFRTNLSQELEFTAHQAL